MLVGFHSQTPGLPRWGAGLGQGQKSQAGCPNPPGASPWSVCPADRTRPLEAGPAVPGVGTTSGARSSLFQARAAPPPCVHPTPAEICFSSKQPAPPSRSQMAQEGHYFDVFPCLSAHDGTANTRRSLGTGAREALQDQEAGSAGGDGSVALNCSAGAQLSTDNSWRGQEWPFSNCSAPQGTRNKSTDMVNGLHELNMSWDNVKDEKREGKD